MTSTDPCPGPAIDLSLLHGFRFTCRPGCGLCCYATPAASPSEQQTLLRLDPSVRFVGGSGAFRSRSLPARRWRLSVPRVGTVHRSFRPPVPLPGVPALDPRRGGLAGLPGLDLSRSDGGRARPVGAARTPRRTTGGSRRGARRHDGRGRERRAHPLRGCCSAVAAGSPQRRGPQKPQRARRPTALRLGSWDLPDGRRPVLHLSPRGIGRSRTAPSLL